LLGWHVAHAQERPMARAGLRAAEKERERVGPQEGKEREDFFFLKLFSNHFQTFKHQSNKKPCIRIMMHIL
jgi:hypothetical protein